MNAGQLLFVFSDLIAGLVTLGVLKTDGTFVAPNPKQDAEIAVLVENTLKNRGVVVPGKIDKVVQAIPLIVALVS